MAIMASGNWRVGVLFSETGVTAAIERTQRAATLLAIRQINEAGGVLGRMIEPVIYDPQSTPRRYRELAIRLCDEDQVRVVFGCHMSSTRKAALPIIEARGAILFYPTLYEGFEYSRNCIYTGAAPNQNSVQLVDYLVKNYGRRVFLVGSNYVYPYESNRIISDLFLQNRGEVVDELYVPLELEPSHIDKIIQRIKVSRPDVIYSTIVGAGIVPFFNEFANAGFNMLEMPIASQSTSEADLAQMSSSVTRGHITAAPFFATLRTSRAEAFVNAYHESCGPDMPVTAPAEAAYFQVFLYAAALVQSRSDRYADLLPSLYEVEYAAPHGLVKVERSNNHTHLWPRIGKVDEVGNYEIVYEPTVRVAPDPFMLEYRMDSPEFRPQLART
jgi:branched-chain amino acid transport system substrate-binding protein